MIFYLFLFLEIVKRVIEVEILFFCFMVVNFIIGVEEFRELMKLCWEEKFEVCLDFYDIRKIMYRIVSNSGM